MQPTTKVLGEMHIIVGLKQHVREFGVADALLAVVKPVADGSSVGVFIIMDEKAPPPAALAAKDWKHGEDMLVETYIAGKELTCAVMGDKALDVIEIVPNVEFYDYDAKYAKGGSFHVCPAQISPKIYQRIQQLALTAHQSIGCRGVSRSDFRYDDASDTLVWLEVNTQPGMTGTSLVPEMAAHAGHSFEELVTWMVNDASLDR